MEMGMALVFDEASEFVPPPPADYGMCGAAGDYKTFTAFATEEIIMNTTTHTIVANNTKNKAQHDEVFQVLISFVVILGVLALAALLWVYLSRRKVNGMFVTLDSSIGAGEGPVNTMNPLSSFHEAGSELDEESGTELVEVSFVRAARSAVQKHQADKSSGHRSNSKLPTEESSVLDDEAEHGGAMHPVRKPLTWRSSQGLKK